MMGTLVVKGLKGLKPMMRIFNFLYIFVWFSVSHIARFFYLLYFRKCSVVHIVFSQISQKFAGPNPNLWLDGARETKIYLILPVGSMTLKIALKKMSNCHYIKSCPYSEFFWSVFSGIWTEYGDLRSKSPYSVQMRENADQKNSEYGHFLRSV